MQAIANFQTDQAARYLRELARHFGRKTPVTADETSANVAFAFGHCDLRSDDTCLTLIASAEDVTQLDKVTQVISDHLERFAFRENPQLDWRTEPSASQT